MCRHYKRNDDRCCRKCNGKHDKCHKRHDDRCCRKCNGRQDKCHKDFNSLVCNIEKLEKRLLKSVKEPLTVTRNEFNVPTISGGTFEEMYFALGYESMRDRLSQFYINMKVLSGQGASIFGPVFVPSDISMRRAAPSFSEAENQFLNNVNIISRKMITNFIDGANQRIQDVIDGKPDAPLPAEFVALGILPEPISLSEYLVGLQNLFVQFGGALTGFNNILTYFSLIEGLVALSGYNVNDAEEIASDLYSQKRKRANGTLKDCVKTLALGCNGKPVGHVKTKIKSSSLSLQVKERVDSDDKTVRTISDYLKEANEIVELLKEKGVKGFSSYGISVSGKNTLSGKPLGIYGPQAQLTDIPGLLFNVILKNKELNFEHNTFPGFGGLAITTGLGGFKNRNYIYSNSIVTGSLPGFGVLLQDPNEDIFLRTDVIEVRGGGDVLLDVFGSPYLGYVVQTNVVSPLFEGEKSLVRRSLDFGNELDVLNGFFLIDFVDSLDEYKDTIRGPGWTNSIGFFRMGHDNQCNSWGGQIGSWYDFNTSYVIPQGILGVDIPPTNTIPRRNGYIIKNPKSGNATTWNTPLTQCLLSVYGDAENSRVQWIDQLIQNMTRKRNMTSAEAKSIQTLIGNAVAGAELPFDEPQQNYNADPFHYLFRDRFFEAVISNPTPDRLASIFLLQDFNGGFVEGDRFDIINSLDISDKWMLAQQWLWYVQASILEPVFGPVWPLFVFSSGKGFSDSTIYDRNILALIARLLDISTVSNPVFFPNWLSGVDVDLLIAEALDLALDALGGFASQPWGENKRKLANYASPILGPLSLNCGDPPVANRSIVYFVSESIKNGFNVSSVLQVGESGLILFEDGVPTVQDDAMMCPYVRFEVLTNPTITTKKICK